MLQLVEVSPKKTWEGFFGGCVAAFTISSTGAYLMGWPFPLMTGGSTELPSSLAMLRCFERKDLFSAHA